jgi:hypothetical protein
MTHDELLEELNEIMKDFDQKYDNSNPYYKALRAVVELHKPYNPQPLQPDWFLCEGCDCGDPYLSPEYPCPTIQAIEKEIE